MLSLAHIPPQGKLPAAVCTQLNQLLKDAEEWRTHLFDTDAIVRRANRAATIIRQQRVLCPLTPNDYGSYAGEIARVVGRREEPYLITFDGEYVHCTCPDYVDTAAPTAAPILPSGQRACKHIIAVLLLEAAAEEGYKNEICT